MKAYKLVRLGKDGKCYPLFINKHEPFVFGKQMVAHCYPTKGFAVKSQGGEWILAKKITPIRIINKEEVL